MPTHSEVIERLQADNDRLRAAIADAERDVADAERLGDALAEAETVEEYLTGQRAWRTWRERGDAT